MTTAKQTRTTGRFEVTDQNGRRYAAVEFTEFLYTPTLDDSNPAPISGMKSYRLETGQFLNKVDDQSFETASRDLQLRRA